ncbi:SET domain protein, partial [Ichthyophthirius multifiliis]
KNYFQISQQSYLLEKICEICQDFHNEDKLLLCDYCEDAYHIYCLNPPLNNVPGEEEDWFCSICIQQKQEYEKQKLNKNINGQTCLDQYQFIKDCKNNEKILICSYCNGNKLTNKQSIILEESEKCMKCQKIYHKACFNQRKDSIICFDCQQQIKKTIPNNQKTLDQYFQQSQQLIYKNVPLKYIMNIENSSKKQKEQEPYLQKQNEE